MAICRLHLALARYPRTARPLEMKMLAAKNHRSSYWSSSAVSLNIVALLVMSSVPTRTPGQEQRVSQYAHRAWLVRDGFFGGAPDAITQTTEGYIWIGT